MSPARVSLSLLVLSAAIPVLAAQEPAKAPSASPLPTQAADPPPPAAATPSPDPLPGARWPIA